MAAKALSDDEFKILCKEFFKTESISFNSLIKFVTDLQNKNCFVFHLRRILEKAVSKMSEVELSALLAHKDSKLCPEWLKGWHYSLTRKTPDDHLKFVLNDGARIVNHNWDLIPTETRLELLKIIRDGFKVGAANGRLQRLKEAEVRLARDMEEVTKLKERVKRDASPTRK